MTRIYKDMAQPLDTVNSAGKKNHSLNTKKHAVQSYCKDRTNQSNHL